MNPSQRASEAKELLHDIGEAVVFGVAVVIALSLVGETILPGFSTFVAPPWALATLIVLGLAARIV